MVLYLVRHGQSEWNLLGLTQGSLTHPVITATGLDQSRIAAQAIASDCGALGADLILSSDLNRAVQTARVIGEVAGGELILDPRLREQGYGGLEGRNYAEANHALAHLDNVESALPGGESVRAVLDRMREVVAETDPQRVTVIVSHGDALRIFLDDLRGLSPRVTGPAWSNGAVARVDASGGIGWLVGSNDG